MELISRRKFFKGAFLVVGATALTACGVKEGEKVEAEAPLKDFNKVDALGRPQTTCANPQGPLTVVKRTCLNDGNGGCIPAVELQSDIDPKCYGAIAENNVRKIDK